MTVHEVDVAVVGAGPGGLEAAIAAAKRGVTVAIFDKKKEIGVPVKCGEYFPVRREMVSLLPNLDGDLASLFDVPEEAVDNICRVLRVISPRGSSWEFEFEAYILDRRIMEKMMAEEALKLGATLRLETHAHLFKKEGETYVGATPQDSVKAKVVIAADGFPSGTAMSAGLPVRKYLTPMNVAVNYEYFMEDLDADMDVTEMYVGNDYAPGGYAWIIPKGEGTANVGTGIRTPFLEDRVKEGMEYLKVFLNHRLSREKLKHAKVCSMIADVLPVDGPLETTYNDCVLAVGDSAGMVMPTNGGGISTAMITGRIAGEVAAEHLMKGASLSTYETLWRRALGSEIDKSTRMRRLADRFMGNDQLFHLMLKLLRVGGIKKVITCQVPAIMKPILRILEPQ